jgi:ABC-type polar amino acid transport system ATPase subunit
MAKIIEMTGLDKSYGKVQVLHNVNLSIATGEVVVIIGASGSGKSTLIRCINGLEQFGAGAIVVDGIALSPTTEGRRRISGKLLEIRREVGMVFQHFNLFPHKTVLENVTLAPMKVRKWDQNRAEKSARRLLDQVGLIDHIQKYPSQHSGGQQQRVAIARSLAMEPRVMLSDEPTSAQIQYRSFRLN